MGLAFDRIHFPELVQVAPTGDDDPTIELPGTFSRCAQQSVDPMA